MSNSPLIVIALATLLGTAMPSAAQIPGYPSKLTRIVVPFPPGGTTDALARILSQKMTDAWGKPVVVENRPGGGGAIAAESVAKAAPDGHTMFLGTTGDMSVNPSLVRKLPYDPERDFIPVGLLAVTPLLLITHPSLPVQSVKELIDAAKAKPGSLSHVSVGDGSAGHLAGEMFKKLTQTDIVHVPYKGGGPQVTALLAGQEPQFGFVVTSTARPHLLSGKLRALAVSSAKRSPFFPDVPALVELGLPGFDFANWFGMFLPAGSPKEIAGFINTECARILKLPDVAARLVEMSFETALSSPDELSRYLTAEISKYRKIIAEAGITPQ
ncbi:MAG: Bug family tripartite tricarboxylate transporter substrate binding protein [Burkholderiales bacterium]